MNKCNKCERETSDSYTVYEGKEIKLICDGCYQKQAGVQPPQDSLLEENYVFVEKVGYKCINCGFEFERNKEVTMDSCPYCAQNTLEKL